MSYFRNFPIIPYFFGNEVSPAQFQNISSYIDLIDQVANEANYYELYEIRDGERPDVLSYRLYGTSDYYWMFYLLNDKIRLQGWPLSEQEIISFSKEYYPNLVLKTNRSMFSEFYVNDYVASATGAGFVNPDFKAVIIEKNYDLGQLIVRPLKEVRSITVTSGGSGYTTIPTVTISGGSGEGATAAAVIDSDPLSPTYKQVTAITVTDGGDDFSAVPTVTISNPDEASGTRATATASLSTNTLTISGEATIYTKRNDKDVANWSLSDVEPLLVWGQNYQYDAPHHYENSAGDWIDLEYIPDTQYGVQNKPGTITIGSTTVNGTTGKTPITYTERLRREVDAVRDIRVFKPNVANQINAEYQRLLKQ